LLEALRHTHQYFPAEVVAYMRGRCWQQLDRHEPAFWFFDRAHKLAPSNQNYAFMRLDALLRTGRDQDAFAEAQQLLSQRDAPATLVFGAAKVFYDSAAHLTPSERRQLYENIVSAVSAALNTIDQNESIEATTPQSLILSGRLHLALAYERLGKPEDAMRAYVDAIAHHPNSDELLMARALFFLKTGQHAAAQKDLDALIRRGTHLVSAYLFRAHHFLMQHDYVQCLELSDRGLRLATRTATRVLFLEWTAISLYERHASLENVRLYFEKALSLDPMNDNVRSNLEVLDQAPAATHPSLTNPADPDPSDALRELREQLQPAA
jgi:tetratricopeptide (TPR) repeat protein